MQTVEVELARVVDRDHLRETLAERGVEAHPFEERGRLVLEVPCADGDYDRLCDDLLSELESWVRSEGVPLVPMTANGSIFLRPPGE